MRFWLRFLFLTVMLLNSPANARQFTPEFVPDFVPDFAVDLPLEGEALTDLFMDRTHRGYYQYGDWVDRDPAFTERMNADGTTLHIQDGEAISGTWRTYRNLVCFEYDELNGGCFRIYVSGTCHYAVSAYIDEIVAITVLEDETPNCEPSFA
jgi:hypothetical protein